MTRRPRRKLPKRVWTQYKPDNTAQWQTANRKQERYLRYCVENGISPDDAREAFLFLAEPKAV